MISCAAVEHLRGYKSLAEDTPLLKQHVVEEVENVLSVNQLGENPLLGPTPPPITEPAFLN